MAPPLEGRGRQEQLDRNLHFLLELAALKGDDSVIVSRCPSFRIAIDKGDESRLANRVAATFQKAIVFVFAVNYADVSIIFHKRDREEFSLGLIDEGVQFGADFSRCHGSCISFVVEIGFTTTSKTFSSLDFIVNENQNAANGCYSSKNKNGVQDSVEVDLHNVVFGYG